MKTKFDFNELTEIAADDNFIGIYAIHSKYDNKNYVGQCKGTRGLRQRFYEHRLALRKNSHFNQYLQRSYNKHGEKQFEFIILEICNKNDNLYEKEGYWIQKLKSMKNENGWNLILIESNGIINSVNGKKFKIIAPDGKIIIGNNVAKFARENNLIKGSLSLLIKGKSLYHRGWRNIDAPPQKIYRVINEYGEIFEIEKPCLFAKEHNLHKETFRLMVYGKLSRCGTWKSLDFMNNFETNRIYGRYNINKEVKILSPDLKVHIFKDYIKFCEKYELNEQMMLRVIRKDGRKSVYGWMLFDEDINLYGLKNKITGKIVFGIGYKSLIPQINKTITYINNIFKKRHIIDQEWEIYNGPFNLEEIREDF